MEIASKNSGTCFGECARTDNKYFETVRPWRQKNPCYCLNRSSIQIANIICERKKPIRSKPLQDADFPFSWVLLGSGHETADAEVLHQALWRAWKHTNQHPCWATFEADRAQLVPRHKRQYLWLRILSANSSTQEVVNPVGCLFDWDFAETRSELWVLHTACSSTSIRLDGTFRRYSRDGWTVAWVFAANDAVTG